MHRRALYHEANDGWLNPKPDEFAWNYKFYVDKYYEMKMRYGRNVQLLRFEDVCRDNSCLLGTVIDVLGADILYSNPISAVDHGQSDIGTLLEPGEAYHQAQKEILGSTLEYLKYDRWPTL